MAHKIYLTWPTDSNHKKTLPNHPTLLCDKKQLPRLRQGLTLTFSTQLYVEASQVSGSGFHMTHLSETLLHVTMGGYSCELHKDSSTEILWSKTQKAYDTPKVYT